MTKSGARVVVLPNPSWVDRSEAIATIERLGIACLAIDEPVESKSICARLLTAELQPPLVIVAHADACLQLPAVALSLRTQHRNTLGYVLVDPDAPPATDIWPESPVFVVSSIEATGTSLRGWPVVHSDGDAPALIAQLASQLLAG